MRGHNFGGGLRLTSGSVVENDAERVALTRSQLADAVAHFYPVVAARTEFRSFIDSKCHAVAFPEPHNLDPRLAEFGPAVAVVRFAAYRNSGTAANPSSALSHSRVSTSSAALPLSGVASVASPKMPDSEYSGSSGSLVSTPGW